MIMQSDGRWRDNYRSVSLWERESWKLREESLRPCQVTIRSGEGEIARSKRLALLLIGVIFGFALGILGFLLLLVLNMMGSNASP